MMRFAVEMPKMIDRRVLMRPLRTLSRGGDTQVTGMKS